MSEVTELAKRLQAAIARTHEIGGKVQIDPKDAQRLLLLVKQRADGVCRCTNCRRNS
jgi:hypothetical protein